MIDRQPKTVQDLLDELLALPEEARGHVVYPYSMGDLYTVRRLEVEFRGGGLVETNLNYDEDNP